MKPTLAKLSAFIGIALMVIVTPASAEDSTQTKRLMSLTGTGEVKAEPDMAVITIGVVREARTAREALTANNQAMASITETVVRAGVAEKDIQTSGFSVNPKYQHPKRSSSGERPAPKIVGYIVSNNVSVVVRKLDELGGLLDGVVDAGSNQINGIAFGISNPAPLEDAARKAATGDAIAKAELYAQAAKVKLGQITSISERAHGIFPQQRGANFRAMAASAEAVPIARGEHSITMQVHITWEIE